MLKIYKYLKLNKIIINKNSLILLGLQDLSKSSPNEKVKKAARGTLWVMEKNLDSSDSVVVSHSQDEDDTLYGKFF